MNKKVIMAIGAMTIAAVLGLIFSQTLSVSADPNLSYKDVEDKVGSQYPGKIVEIELDNKGKRPIYEVEIEIEGKEYELLIDGNTGEVLKLDEKLTKVVNETTVPEEETATKEDTSLEINEKEEEKKETEVVSNDEKDDKEVATKSKETKVVSAPQKETKKSENNTSKASESKSDSTPKADKKKESKSTKNDNNKKSIISKEEAIQIALNQFSGKVDDVELEKDDGRLIYEIEIENDRGDEAEIEIDAYTGKVLVVDIDLEDDDD